LLNAVHAAHATRPPRGIAFNNHKWGAQPVARFRGQETIDRALKCARGER
jgi:hypothetical protein